MKVKVETCRKLKLYSTIKSLLVNQFGQAILKDGFDVCLSLDKEGRTNYIRLMYKIWNDEVEGVSVRVNDYDYRVKLARTKCHIAGWRYWFTCPLTNKEDKACGNRVSTLYLPPDDKYFGCRHCHDLIYQSQCLSGKDKKFGVIIPFDVINERERSFKQREYNGMPTRKYSAFIHKAVKNHFGFQGRTDALKKQLRQG